jgi:hypothetical protein
VLAENESHLALFIETHPQLQIHPPVKAQSVLTFDDHTLPMVTPRSLGALPVPRPRDRPPIGSRSHRPNGSVFLRLAPWSP